MSDQAVGSHARQQNTYGSRSYSSASSPVMPYLTFLLRFCVGEILLIAGTSKLFERSEFLQVVESYQILPRPVALRLARALPLLEIAVGFLLLIGLGTTIAALVAVLLFTAFSIAIGINLKRGIEVECHCFGKLYREKISPAAFFRNIALALFAMYLVMFSDRYVALDELFVQESATRFLMVLFHVGLLVAVGGLTVLVVVAGQRLANITTD